MEGNKRYHFVLVHGLSHGAWCWYKTIDLLEKAGHKATAIDLAACGLHPADLTRITSFKQYNQPLIDVLASLEPSEKVILVGHSMGGVSLIDAAGRFPNKIAVAVYVSAMMLFGGFRISEYLQMHKVVNDDGTEQDIVLSGLLRRPFPSCCLKAEIKHSVEVIESVPRVFVKLEKDNAILVSIQDAMIRKHPPAQVLSLITDHSPFFSSPKELNDLLLQIAETYNS
ncbi:hypothetical protein O6H91_04G062900 [Diphasiastrum complanatum]|uniref:Uncharacterized protein n=1 Tax=Diphasiastrum complanatum TaxID=34168 RepID=A0ACC2DXR1_DIPCM|nr:hypothetical protein O6H91_04G062900 [Diphasiastrum complanatum]